MDMRLIETAPYHVHMIYGSPRISVNLCTGVHPQNRQNEGKAERREIVFEPFLKDLHETPFA